MTLTSKLKNVRPRLQVLATEQMNEVHRYSISILEETGIKVESKTALEIFRKSDAAKVKNEVVYLTRELINHAIQQAPSNIEIFSKNGDVAFHMGEKQGEQTHFGIGVTNTWFQNIEDNKVEPFTREHMQYSTQLGNLLENYDMVSTLGIPSDLDASQSDMYSALDMYANSVKPLVLLISGEDQINPVLELLSKLHGDISSKPFCIPYVNPITPLVLNKDTTDKMMASIDFDLPLMFSNYSMYGGTSPATEGGSLTLLNAELLAGLVFSQLVKEGSKIILGSLPAAFDMRTMGSQYTPSSYLMNLACAEMMNFYNIPHCGTSGSNSGRGPDLMASGDLWFNHLSSCIGKVGSAPFVGGNFASMAFSPSTVVLSNQIIGDARKFAAGFTLSNEAVNLPEIDKVGHGGNYFISEQTIASLDELSSTDSIWSSMNLDTWRTQNMPTAEQALIDHTMDLYSKAKTAAKESVDLTKKGEDYINTLLS